MVNHETRIGRLEETVNDPEDGLCKKVDNNSTSCITLRATMKAIIWMFGILIALGIVNIVIGRI